MNIIRFKSLIIIFLVGMLMSCQSNSATGPCEYNEEKFNMIIIDVLENSENPDKMEVLVDFDGNVRFAHKTYTLEEVREVETTAKFVKDNHIKVGHIYKGTVFTKVEGSGNCDEEIVQWENGLNK